MQFVILLIVIILVLIALYIKASNLNGSHQAPAPMILLAGFLSNKNESVVADVNLYLNSAKDYFEKYEDNLFQRELRAQSR